MWGLAMLKPFLNLSNEFFGIERLGDIVIAFQVESFQTVSPVQTSPSPEHYNMTTSNATGSNICGSVAGAEVFVRLSLCAVHRPFLFVGLTSSSFSRHAIVKASFTMVIWLNENIKLPVAYSLLLRKPPRRPSRTGERALGDVRRRLLLKGRKKDTS